jgi:hypothetical protein
MVHMGARTRSTRTFDFATKVNVILVQEESISQSTPPSAQIGSSPDAQVHSLSAREAALWLEIIPISVEQLWFGMASSKIEGVRH